MSDNRDLIIADLRRQLAERDAAPPVVAGQQEVLGPAKRDPSTAEVLMWLVQLAIKTNRAAWPDEWNLPGLGDPTPTGSTDLTVVG